MSALNILIAQSFTHMVESEAQAEQTIEKYKEKFTVKKSTTDRKIKKGVEYWEVKVEVEHLSKKDAFDTYFDLEG